MVKKTGLIVLLLALCLSYTAMTSRAAGKISKEALQGLVDQAVKDGLVGVSAAVSTPDDGIMLVTAGVSDRKGGTNLAPTDIARIASSSKVWVATAFLQLVQEGKISIDDPIAKYIKPDNAANIANADTATVAQVLSHTSGIFDYYNQSGFGNDVPNKMDFTIDEALKYTWNQPANFKPGAKFGYSNTNTVLLAQAMETVTGQPFAVEMRKRIFDPMGLKHTYVEVFEKVPVKIARGYEFNEDGSVIEVGDKYQGGGLPDGALVSTPEDMMIFMRALFGDGKLLDKATVAKMVTPVADAGDKSSMGYHIFISDTDNGKRYEHDGAINGYRAIEMFYPDSGVAIALWTNTGGKAQDDVFQTLQDDVAKLVFESK